MTTRDYYNQLFCSTPSNNDALVFALLALLFKLHPEEEISVALKAVVEDMPKMCSHPCSLGWKIEERLDQLEYFNKVRSNGFDWDI